MPQAAREKGARTARALADAWALGLAIVLVLPLLTAGGHPLARDLMFVPHQPWTPSALGLGDAAPRAVPLDAVVSLLTQVVDGGWLARVVLPLALASAGWGVARLVGGIGATARLVGAGLAVWNPFVVERLAMGQWALLVAYAALPWIWRSAVRWREANRARDLAVLVLWLAAASLTPTGGLLGLATATVAAWRPGRRVGAVVLPGLLLQAPWVVAGLASTARAVSDSAGVAAFAARGEAPGGPVVALLGLGGIWNAHTVPASRETLLGLVVALLVAVALCLGRRPLREAWGGGDASRMLGLGLGALALAALSALPGGNDLVGWLVANVPGAGLLRDGQKLLAPFVLLVAVSVAAATGRLVARLQSSGAEVLVPVGITAVLGPVLLLPDAGRVVWPVVDPVDYPSDFDRVADVLDEKPRGTLATLPWRSYRAFEWGAEVVAADPALRWFDGDVVVADELVVNGTPVAGEGARATDLGEALASSPPATAFAAHGIRWALVYEDDPVAEALDRTGLRKVYGGRHLTLYEVPGVDSEGVVVAAGRRAAVVVAHGIALVIVLAAVGLLIAVMTGRSSHRRTWLLGGTLPRDREREN